MYMILPVLNSSIKNTPDINFKGRLVRQASEIKNFPKLTCPVCGGPIIAPDVLADAYRVVSLPLKSVLKLDFLDKTKKMPKVWEILLNFAKKYPKKSLDKILENEEEHDIFRNSIEKTIVPDLDRENKEEYEKHMRDFNSVESKIKECARGKLRSSSIVINRFKSFIPMLKKMKKTPLTKWMFKQK